MKLPSLKIFSFFFLIQALLPAFAQNQQPVDYVNPLIGTDSKYTLSNGNTYPAIARPWGMNFWSPQTGKMGDGWLYVYHADKIKGFRQTHQPSPWMNDYGQFSIMPVTKPYFEEKKRGSWFSHKAEKVHPYYYSVYLADYDVNTEMSTTERCGIFRIKYPEQQPAYIVVDAFDKGSEVRYVPEKNAIVGYSTRNSEGVSENFKDYFVIVFDKKIEKVQFFLDNKSVPDVDSINGNHAGSIVSFGTLGKNNILHAKVASSFISERQAWQNLKEIKDFDFDKVVKEGKKEWNDVLSRIQVEDQNVDRLRTFYSSLYRSLLFPRKLYEIDEKGQILHYSPYNGKIEKGYLYGDTGFWDTFRSLFPLLNLVYPSENVKIQKGLVNAYKESGFLPEWSSPGHRGTMIGNNSASVVADAYLKGLRGYDIETLYKALLHGANSVHPTVDATGRRGYKYYNELGYVPYDVKIKENAARTLEYAYDDWTIYRLGKALGKQEKEIGIYAKRAMNYKNLFNKKYGLMSGRNKNGSFPKSFNPFKWGDAFTEGNSWHYTWSVFHDPQGLIDLMGGSKKFVAKLDSVFTLPPIFDNSYYGHTIHEIREMQVANMGQYAHGNQPIQHMIYLYGYAGEPWKTQYWVREALTRLYTPNPDGYCGDEDNGQTSSWYIFSAMGFYPVAPGSGEYVVGAPLFKKVTINLENNKKIEIDAPNNSDKNRYIGTMKFNNKRYTKNYLRHSDLMNGAKIDFKMTDSPNKRRGVQKSDAPYSFSNVKK